MEYIVAIHNIDSTKPTKENEEKRCILSGKRVSLIFFGESLQIPCPAVGCDCRVDVHPTTRINIG